MATRRRARTALLWLLTVSLALVTFADARVFADDGELATGNTEPDPPPTTDPPTTTDTPPTTEPPPTAEAPPTTAAPTPTESQPTSITTTTSPASATPEEAPPTPAPESPSSTIELEPVPATTIPQPVVEGEGEGLPASLEPPAMMLSTIESGGPVFPLAPRNLRVEERTDTTLTLAWDPPLPNNAEIDHYELQAGTVTGGPWFGDYTERHGTSATLPWTSDSSARFSVYAVGASGSYGDRSNVVTVYQLPRAVLEIDATPGDASASLQWEDLSPGDWPGLRYRIEQWDPLSGDWERVQHTPSPHWLATGLTNGVEYRFRVVVEHGQLEGPPSEEASVTPMEGATVPSRPTLVSVDGSLSAGPGLGKVRVEWEPPSAVPDGWTLTRYVVQYNYLPLAYGWDYNADDFTDDGVSTSQVLRMSPGSDYAVRVVPEYSVPGQGDGVLGEPSNVMYVSVAPGAPTNLHVAPGDLSPSTDGRRSVRLEWNAPTGYSGIVGYWVEYQPQWDFFNDPNGWSSAHHEMIEETHATVSPESFVTDPDIDYRFRVRAVTIVDDWDVLSAPSNLAQTAPWEVLAAPTGVTATGGDRSVVVAWDPAGERTHEVQLAASASGPWYPTGSVAAGTSELTVGDLAPGLEYFFRVRGAPEAPYVGAWSAAVSATPTGPPVFPSAPRGLQIAERTDTALTLTWEPPESGADAIDHYVLQARWPSGWWGSVATSEGLSITVPRSDTDGRWLSVYAVTSSDVLGDRSLPVRTYRVPDQLSLWAEATDGGAMLYWDDQSQVDWPGLHYRIEQSPNGTDQWSTAHTTQIAHWLATDLSNDVTYWFRAVLVHDGQESEPSTPMPVTPRAGAPVPPGPPVLAPVESDLNASLGLGLGQVRVRWTPPAVGFGQAAIDRVVVEYRRITADAGWYAVEYGSMSPLVVDLVPDIQYELRAVAVDVNGRRGEPSNLRLVTVDPGAPANLHVDFENLTPTAGDARSVTLDWDAPTGYVADGYVVEILPQEDFRCDPGCWWQATDGLVTDTHVTITDGYLAAQPEHIEWRFRVRAIVGDPYSEDPHLTSGASNLAQTAPWRVLAAPSDVTATPGDGSVLVAWGEPADARAHEVQVALAEGGPWTPAGSAPAGTFELAVGDLAPGLEYWFRVRSAPDAPYVSPWSAAVPAIPEGSAAAVPTGLHVVTQTVGAPIESVLTLAWTAPSGPVDHYVIERRALYGDRWQSIGESEGPSFTTTDWYERYGHYRVYAVNDEGSGGRSDALTVYQLLPQVARPDATPGNASADLQWTPLGVGEWPGLWYRVEQATLGTPFEEVGRTQSARWVDTGLTNGIEYTYRVVAEHGGKEGPPSAPRSVTPSASDVLPPGPPTLLSVDVDAGQDLGLGQARVTWTAPPAVDGQLPVDIYIVEYTPLMTGFIWDSSGISDPAATTHTFSGLRPGERYAVRVVAQAANGQRGEPSNIKFVTADPGEPTNLRLAAGDQNPTVDGRRAVSLEWDAPSYGGIVGYAIEFQDEQFFDQCGSSCDWWEAHEGLVTGTHATVSPEYFDEELDAGYRFHVRAVTGSDAVRSGPSDAVRSASWLVLDAPSGVTATGGDFSVRVAWTDPDTPRIHQVQIAADDGVWSTAGSAPAGTSELTVGDLEPDAEYSFRVRVAPGGGSVGRWSDIVSAPAMVLGAPTAVVATRGDGSVNLTWALPASTGGSPLTGYRIERRADTDGSAWATVADVDAGTLSFAVTGPPNEPSRFRVRALSAAGVGAPSDERVGTVRTMPPAVTGLVAAPASGQVGLTWDRVLTDQPAALVRYVVEQGTTADGPWTPIGATPAQPWTTAVNSWTVTGLANGTAVSFRVTAVNGAGDPIDTGTTHPGLTGPSSTPATVTPNVSVPSSPALWFSRGDGTITFNWFPPASDGGSPITEYRLERAPAGSSDYSLVGTATEHSLTITSTAPITTAIGTRYRYRVVAANEAGAGTPSNSFETWLRNVPVVTGLVATPGDQHVTLTWTTIGADSSTEYRVERAPAPDGPWTNPSGVVHDTTATESAVNGTTYYWRVIAVNGGFDQTASNNPIVGPFAEPLYGAPTEPVAATPVGPPSAPTDFAFERGDGTITFTWLAPASDGGSPILGYWLERAPAASSDFFPIGHMDADARSITVTHSAPDFTPLGTAYRYRVGARNAHGVTPSNWYETRLRNVPVVTDLQAAPGVGQVALTWDATGTDSSTRYQIEEATNPNGPWSTVADSVAARAFTVETISTAYWRVRGVNGINDSASGPGNEPLVGPFAEPVSATPERVTPSAPQDFVAQRIASTVTLTWSEPASDGGSPFTGYTVSTATSPTGPWTVVSGNAFSGMQVVDEGSEPRWFQVIASNINGMGEPAIARAAAVPGAVQGLGHQRGDGTVTLSWRLPGSNGGSPITGYRVERAESVEGPWTQVATRAADAPSVSVTVDGPLDVRRWFRVVAVNAAGDGEATVLDLTLRGSPSQVTNLEAWPGSVVLTWDEATAASPNPDITYYVERSTSPGGGYAPLGSTDELMFTDTSVVGGTTYWYRVYASNGVNDLVAGENQGVGVAGEPSVPVSIAATSVPSAPTITSAVVAPVVGAGEVRLAWSVPATGGSPILDYVVDYQRTSAGAGDPWILADDGYGTATTATITGLTIGTAYRFRVTAVNGIGVGAPSAVVTATPGAVVPGVPRELTAAATATGVVLTWEPPTTNGGSPILDYVLLRGPSASGPWSVVSHDAVSPFTVDDMTYPERAWFAVAARNSIEYGDPAFVEGGPIAVPSAPTGVWVTRGDGTMTFDWEPPADDGGSPITSYRIYRGAVSTPALETTELTGTIAGAVNQNITYRIAAVNIAGEGPSSDRFLIARTIPAAPQLTATPGDRQVTLSWTAAGSTNANLRYFVQRATNPDGPWTTITSFLTARTYTNTGLTNATTYHYRVYATNGATDGVNHPNSPGPALQGPNSNTTTVTPLGTPSAPQNFFASLNSNGVTFTWQPPASDGGSPITGYSLATSTSPNGSWGVITAEAFSGMTLFTTDGQARWYRLVPRNAIGIGEPAIVQATAPTVPSAPLNFGFTRSDRALTFTWQTPTDTGGLGISYRLERAPGTSGNFTEVAVIPGYQQSTTISVPWNSTEFGVVYQYRVVAVNGVGASPPSAARTAVMREAPRITFAPIPEPGDRSVTLRWAAVYYTDATTRYEVQQATSPDGPWIGVSSVTATSVTINYLNNGSTYYWRVRPVNGAFDIANYGPGNNALLGPYSHLVGVTPGAPSEPLRLSAEAGPGSATLTWQVPKVEGSEPITSYLVQQLSPTGEWTTITTAELARPAYRVRLTVPMLDPDVVHHFRVIAVNDISQSAPGSAVGVTPLVVPDGAPPVEPLPETVTISVPATPAGLSLTPGWLSVTLAWEPPTNDGGSPITGYVVQVSSDETLWSDYHPPAGAMSFVWNGGVRAWPLRVLASNADGDSAPSETMQMPGASAPGKPTMVRLQKDAQKIVTITWQPPESDGGSPILGYEVSDPNTSVLLATLPASARTFTDSEPLGDTTRYYRLVAVTAVARSAPVNLGAHPVY